MATDLMNAHPDLTGLVGECTSSAPGVAQAVQDAGKIGQVFTVGLGTPQSMKPYLEDGSSSAAILWDVENLGYLTAWAGAQLARGQARSRRRTTSAPSCRPSSTTRAARCCCSARRWRSPTRTSTSSTTEPDRVGPGGPALRSGRPPFRHGARPTVDQRRKGARSWLSTESIRRHRGDAGATAGRGRRGSRLRLTGISKRFGAVRAIRNGDITIRAGRGARPRRGERRRQVHDDQDHLRGGVGGHRDASSSRARPVDHPLHHATRWPWASPPSIRSRSCSPSSPCRRTSSPAARSARAAGWTGPRRTPRSSSCWSCSGCRPGTRPCRSATLSIAEQQQVSIAKALAGDAKVLILDEPSAILTDAEIDVLFEVVRRLTASGVVGHLHLAPARRAVPHRRRGDRDARRADHRHVPDRGAHRAPGRRADGRRHPVRRAAAARGPGRRPGAGARRVWAAPASSTTSTWRCAAARSSGSTGWSAPGSPRSPPASTESTARPAGEMRLDGKRIAPRSPAGRAEAGHRAAAGQPQARGHVRRSSRSRSTSRPGT